MHAQHVANQVTFVIS